MRDKTDKRKAESKPSKPGKPKDGKKSKGMKDKKKKDKKDRKGRKDKKKRNKKDKKSKKKSKHRSVAISCETQNRVRPISGAKNQATAMAFGGPRSSCACPGVHSARRQDSRKDLTPRCMALHFVSAGARAPHSDETLGPTATRGSSHSARRLRSLAFLYSSLE